MRLSTILACVGVIILSATLSYSQSLDEGIRILDAGVALQAKSYSESDLQRAMHMFNTALDIFKKHDMKKGIGRALNNLGYVSFRLSRFQDAEQYYLESLPMAESADDPEGYALTQQNLGLFYERKGDYRKAGDHFLTAANMRRTLGLFSDTAESLGHLGDTYKVLGDYKQALETFDRMWALAKQDNNSDMEARSYLKKGNLYFVQQEYPKAIDSFNKSLATCREMKGNRILEAELLGNLANVYTQLAQFNKVYELRTKSLDVFRELDDEAGLCLEEGNMGIFLADLGLHRKAVDYHRRSLALAEKRSDIRAQINAFHNLGRSYSDLGEHDKALASFESEVAACKKAGFPEDSNSFIGNLHLDMGDLAKAEPFIKQSGNPAVLGRLCLVKGDYSKARNFYESELEKSQKIGGAQKVFACQVGLASAYEGIGNYSVAARHFKEAADQIEEERWGLTPSQRANFFHVRIWGFQRTAPYEGLARISLKLNKPDEAFKWSEYTKARVFAESVAARGESLHSGIPPGIWQKDEEIEKHLSSLMRRKEKAFERGDHEATRAVVLEIKKAKSEMDAHIADLRRSYPLFAATKYPRPIEIAQAGLKPHEWALAYDVTDTGVLIYLLNGKQQVMKPLFKPVPRKELDRLVREFRMAFENVTEQNIREKLKAFNIGVANKLAGLLVKDILSQLPRDVPVTVVPDDSLGTIPFEMLVMNTAGEIQSDKELPCVKGAEFFGDRNSISYFQSVTALTLARSLQKPKIRGDRLLVMADPVFKLDDHRAPGASAHLVPSDDGRLFTEALASIEDAKTGDLKFKRLPATGNLARNLANLYGDKAKMFVGLEASKENLMGTLAENPDRYSALVFATHGYFRRANPVFLEPILAFTLVPPGRDGFLRMSEVMQLKLNADIVALTACRTGLGEELSGEGVASMGRAFQFAGARTVLMSLWSVAENSSVILVESFFRNLKEGRGKLDALKRAREDVKKAGYDHPFFWAPFILCGEVN